ncbi:hypothetical protein FA10DRAFT_261265 [Acaromyces ingoldii]|uniref:Uncharacterized protein n=1 Tax=Acaromyces ingoldii TaxID=215250 RepID=A0A316YN09_9BASI|nr:hypothetical protein FA10DRAFT_261265 [Acaromyces ingoldii]PWN89453.1 hypothetical protein FA10DRAFT_261265 [Acaromyces ingoldii]
MKFSPFLFILILLHAVTLVASAEEDGEANLVKRARTKERHRKQLVDHWFANHPSQDGESEDPPPTYSSSGESEEWMLEHPSSTYPPSSEFAEEWKPEDAPSTYSSSAESEDRKSRGTSRARFVDRADSVIPLKGSDDA